MTEQRRVRLYGHGKLINGRWVPDEPVRVKPLEALQKQINELRNRVKYMSWEIKRLKGET